MGGGLEPRDGGETRTTGPVASGCDTSKHSSSSTTPAASASTNSSHSSKPAPCGGYTDTMSDTCKPSSSAPTRPCSCSNPPRVGWEVTSWPSKNLILSTEWKAGVDGKGFSGTRHAREEECTAWERLGIDRSCLSPLFRAVGGTGSPFSGVMSRERG